MSMASLVVDFHYLYLYLYQTYCFVSKHIGLLKYFLVNWAQKRHGQKILVSFLVLTRIMLETFVLGNVLMVSWTEIRILQIAPFIFDIWPFVMIGLLLLWLKIRAILSFLKLLNLSKISSTAYLLAAGWHGTCFIVVVLFFTFLAYIIHIYV